MLWGVAMFVREDITSNLLSKHAFPYDTEGMFIETNLRKRKWLMPGKKNHPLRRLDVCFFKFIVTALDEYHKLRGHPLMTSAKNS